MKSKKLPSMVILLILTTITTLFWISFSIYRVFTEDPPTAVSEEILRDINPQLDTQTMEVIKIKLYP